MIESEIREQQRNIRMFTSLSPLFLGEGLQNQKIVFYLNIRIFTGTKNPQRFGFWLLFFFFFFKKLVFSSCLSTINIQGQVIVHHGGLSYTLWRAQHHPWSRAASSTCPSCITKIISRCCHMFPAGRITSGGESVLDQSAIQK